jgi:hypothetical protein
MISAALLAGCTGDSPDDEPTTVAAAPTTEAPSSPEPSPSEEPSEEPSLSPADQAAADAEQTYRGWLALQNSTLQSPPDLTQDSAAAEFDALSAELREYGYDEAEALLTSLVVDYNERGWRQRGDYELLSARASSVDLTSEDERPHVILEACLAASDDFSIVLDSGEVAPEFEEADVPDSFGSQIRVDYLDEEGFAGWYVQSVATTQESDCD